RAGSEKVGGSADHEKVDAELRDDALGGAVVRGYAEPLIAAQHVVVRDAAAHEGHPPILLTFEGRRQGAAEWIDRVGGEAREGLGLRVVGVDLRDAGVGQAVGGEIRRARERHDATVVAHRGVRARAEALRDGNWWPAEGAADPDLRDAGIGPRLRIAAGLEGDQAVPGAQDRVPAP